MKRIAFGTLAAALMSTTAYAADLSGYVDAPVHAAPAAYNWSGIYVGGSVGVVESRSNANIDYNSPELDDPVANWTDGNSFTGGVWHDVDGALLDVTESTIDVVLDDLEEFAPWLTETELSELAYAGTVQIGGQMQFGSLVVGAEVRGTFGEFGNSYSENWSAEVSDSGTTYFEDDGIIENGNEFRAAIHPNGPAADNVVWSGSDDWGDVTFYDGERIDFTGVVMQDNSLSFGVEYDSYFAPVARIGLAADRWMFFAMGGPAVAEVTATTSASVSETGILSYHHDASQDPARFASVDYAWEGTNTETLWGYTIGGGAEFAATDNVILRVEGSMTNLGSISVTGVSADTGATYEVTQDVSNWALSTGVSFKF